MILKSTALAFLGLASTLTGAFAQDILATDTGFLPTINFTDTYAEKPVRTSDGTETVVTERFTAKIVANLTGFDLSELDGTSPVSIAVGDFQFDGTIQDFLPVDRDGNPVDFTSKTNGGTFYYLADKLDRHGDPVTDRNGNTVSVKVGSISLAWTATRLTINVKVIDSTRAEIGSVVDGMGLIGLADDGVKGGVINFAGEGVPCSVTFGSASGARNAYAKGNARTTYKNIDASPSPLNSAGATGAADVTAPGLTATFPTTDNGTGLIDFAGTVSDLAASTLPGSEWVGAVDVSVYVNDPDFAGPIPADDVSDPDNAGKHTYSFSNVPLDPGANTVVLVATDESGNQTVITKTINSSATAF